jgi:hypothetical protein
MLISYHSTTWCHNPEDHDLKINHVCKPSSGRTRKEEFPEKRWLTDEQKGAGNRNLNLSDTSYPDWSEKGMLYHNFVSISFSRTMHYKVLRRWERFLTELKHIRY